MAEQPDIVLVNRGRASDDDRTLDGQYLASYDPNAYQGLGWATWTDDPARAMRFDSFIDALDFWRQQSTVKRLRDDGRPNRPLTAYTVEPKKLDG